MEIFVPGFGIIARIIHGILFSSPFLIISRLIWIFFASEKFKLVFVSNFASSNIYFLKIPYLYLLCSPLESFLIKFQRIFHVFFTFEVYIYIYLQPLSSCFESIKTIAHFACVLLDSLIKWYVSCVYIGTRDPSLPLPLISLAFRSSPSQTVA